MALSPDLLFHTQTPSNAINRKRKFSTEKIRFHCYVQDRYTVSVHRAAQRGRAEAQERALQGGCQAPPSAGPGAGPLGQPRRLSPRHPPTWTDSPGDHPGWGDLTHRLTPSLQVILFNVIIRIYIHTWDKVLTFLTTFKRPIRCDHRAPGCGTKKLLGKHRKRPPAAERTGGMQRTRVTEAVTS